MGQSTEFKRDCCSEPDVSFSCFLCSIERNQLSDNEREICNEIFVESGEIFSEAKRARQFLGRKRRAAEDGNTKLEAVILDDKRARQFMGKRGDHMVNMENEFGEEKRARQFMGKRARQFMGKRARQFLGKRAREFLGKRARQFMG